MAEEIKGDSNVSLYGNWSDSYSNLGGSGSWCDGDVSIHLNEDMTYTGKRQENSGREDPGRTHDFNGTWKESGGSVILTPGYGDFKSDLILKSDTAGPYFSLTIEHCYYETYIHEMKLRKR